ncbi:MAG: saccharopine dehydrogenase NADP-binding domain-containing protein [Candidatus Abyssubacteria bacterium]
MRIVALGGCGVIGTATVKAFLNMTEAAEIIIADRNGKAALDMAKGLGTRVTAAEVNVENAAQLDRILANADIVLNTVGPFYRFGPSVLQAAIRTKTHYIDINDDWEPTLEMLGYHEEARKAGITAIVGVGISPGIMNLMAVRAMRELDTVDTLVTGWSLDAIVREYMHASSMDPSARPGGGVTGAAAVHLMHQASGKIRIYQDGAYADVEPLQEVVLQYPGVGPVSVYTFGHPEPVTLPRMRTDLHNSFNAMYGNRALIELLRSTAQTITAGKIDAYGAAAAMADAQIERMVLAQEYDTPKVPRRFALAIGKSAGIQKSVAVGLSTQPPGGSGVGIGVAAALGIRVVEQGLVKSRGVFAPEDVLDPDGFMNMFAEYCEPPGSKATDILEVAISA